MRICRVRDVKVPNRGTDRSAGIDFFIPENSEDFVNAFMEKNKDITITSDGIFIESGQRVNIPSGIKANVPEGYALIAYNKSGVSLKYGLDIGASVVDEDYQGEIHLSLVNTSNKQVHITYGQKIVQFILLPVFYDSIEEVSEEDCFDFETQRGSGAFGSTGVK